MADEATGAPAPNGTVAPAAGAPDTTSNGGTPPAATPPAPAATAAAPAPVGINSEQLTARLREAEAAGVKKLLKELGFEKPSDVKAVLKIAKDQQDSELTERQRIEKERDELKPRAAKADSLETLVAAMVEEQFTGLPEAAQTAIDEVAKGDAQERLRMMQVMRKAGFLNGAAPHAAAPTTSGAPAPAPKPAPATTAPPANAPKPGAVRSKWDEYQDLNKKNETLGSIFYQTHRIDIEQSRPATQ
jgi:hypothetical protein